MLGTVKNTHAKSASSQKKIDSYADQSEALFDRYTRIERELEEQRLYNRQLEMITETQKGEIPKLEQQLEKIEITHKKIIPLMFEMVETLDKLVAIDTPFLQEERTQRIANLKSFMANPDITLGEQFRMITQSYKIEYGYARTLEVYRSKLEDKTVDFIRVGRLGLYYQTLDLQECGIYDAKNKTWVKLENSYNEHNQKYFYRCNNFIAIT